MQLGLRGDVLLKYAKDWTIEITDISEFVRQQSINNTQDRYDQLIMPREREYPVADSEVAWKLGLGAS